MVLEMGRATRFMLADIKENVPYDLMTDTARAMEAGTLALLTEEYGDRVGR